MSGEAPGSNGIRTSWPELTADVANGKRLAQRVATRAGDDEDHRLLALSNTIEGLTARISDQGIVAETLDIEARARDEQLDARITAQSEQWRRSTRSVEAAIAQLQDNVSAADRRSEILEREILRLRTENSELIEVLESMFGSLASRDDLKSLEARYLELRELVEEARVTAEKAADRADFASDGVSVVQADVEDELSALKERLRQAPSEADLRAEFAAVARKEIRTQAEQLAAIRSELDHRLANGGDPDIGTAKTLRRWQQWIDLPEREIGS